MVAIVHTDMTDEVTTPQRRAAHLAVGSWDDRTLSSQVRDHARADGDRMAVVAPAASRTYAQLDHDADRVVGFLQAAGVRQGDVVAVQLPNWYATVAIGLGVLRLGAVLNPMVTIYRRRELDHMIGVGNARVLFVPGTYRGFDHAVMAQELRRRYPELVTVTVTDPTTDPGWFDDWLAAVPAPAQPSAVEPAAVSQLLFSSGTEAAPKAIMHTEQTAGFGVRSAVRSLGLGTDEIVWMPSPIGHSTGFNFGVRLALDHGYRLVLQDRWDATTAADLVRANDCTFTVAATTFLADLVRHCAAEGVALPSLRLFSSGGAPVPEELVVAARELDLTVLRLYGSTEVLVATWNRPDAPAEKLCGTDGRALDGVEVQVRDEQDRPVVGAAGEIVVRGPACSVGFFADEVRTTRTFVDGWVRSGDLGVIDEQGHLTVVGRKKEIIIRGGMNVAPREIEEVICQVDGVRAAAVVGMPDDRLGEIGCACVVLDPGVTLTLARLVEQLTGLGMAAYKLPEQLVLVSELPATPSGKVQKHRLVAALSDPSSSDRALVRSSERRGPVAPEPESSGSS
ncbi:AMP-binding protein [Pseudonocardia alni]|uniref:AMP-binding protein n=1 Tax=Pseudonocardia alni TaxID=33907 RepID=UPI00332DCC22